MPNLRVVYDNAADRGTITASTTAGTLVPANLQTDYKAEVWRSTGLTATLTINWTVAEQLSMVALAFASLSSASTFRIRCYANPGDATPTLDHTGYAAAGVDLTSLNWGGQPLGANAYSYGGGAYGVVWLPSNQVSRKVVIDITDTNLLGYVEASRLICGTYWSPTNNAEYGVQVGMVDNSKHERTDAGDLRTDRGTVHKTLAFDLAAMTKEDRNSLYNIMRGNGMYKPMLISLTPASTDDVIGEQVFQIYGKLSRQGLIKWNSLNIFSTQISIEEL